MLFSDVLNDLITSFYLSLTDFLNWFNIFSLSRRRLMSLAFFSAYAFPNCLKNFQYQVDAIRKKLSNPADDIDPYHIVVNDVDDFWVVISFEEVKRSDEVHP
jgi:hypothetical protein